MTVMAGIEEVGVPTRHNPQAKVGEVEWPVSNLWKHTGEGGMWVTAFWLVPEGDKFCAPESFSLCCGPGRTVSFREHAVGVDTGEDYDSWFPTYVEAEKSRIKWETEHPDVSYYETHQHFYDSVGPFSYASVDLGSTGGSWINPQVVDTSGYFVATRDNLKRRGKMIVTMLDNLYGVRGKLVTFLDT